MAYRPLADEIRPTSLDEVVGQRHILGKDGLLRRIVEGGNVPNLIFYGPSGTGKTTVANIIAQKTNRPLHRLNATTASISDIKDIMADIGTLLAPEGVLLYLDEIQYFNKKQQQSLLEFMEDGRITLIASTTENPAGRRGGLRGGSSDAYCLRLRRGRAQGYERHRAASHCRQAGARKTPCHPGGCPDRRPEVGYALRPGGGRPFRHRLRPDEVPSRLRPGRRPPLSGPAAGGGGPDYRHPADSVLRQRGHRDGLSYGRAHREGLRGQRSPAGPARGQAASGGGGDFTGHRPQVQHRLYGYQYGDNKTEQAAKRYWEEIKGER